MNHLKGFKLFEKKLESDVREINDILNIGKDIGVDNSYSRDLFNSTFNFFVIIPPFFHIR